MNMLTSNDEIRKALVGSLSSPSEDIAREIMMLAGGRPDSVEKAITTGTGLIAYDLQAPAKNLYPVNAPIIKSLPRVGGGIGTATNWRQVNAIMGSGFDNTPWVPEGQRAGQMSYSTSNKSAPFATIGEEDQVTFEAISAGRTFEDVQASMTMRLLQKMMLKEEAAVVFGNASLQLGTPTAPTLSAPTPANGSSLPAATYSVIVVALTMEGMRNSSLANGVATSKTITGADGKTFTVNGGSSNKSANATQATNAGQGLAASLPAIQGAAGYAWFIGPVGAETLQAITPTNSLLFASALRAGQPATAVTADCSTNGNGFDGLLTTALKAGSGAYVNYLGTGTAGAGTTLTASGRGSVNEIDAMMQSMWDNYQCSVDVLYVNSQQQRDITTKVLTGGTSSLLNYFQDPKAGEVVLTAGGVVEYYYNPYLNKKIPIRLHPNFASGTILGWAGDLPAQYQSNEVPNVAEIKVRRDYYQIDWPIVSRAQMAGVYAEEVLAVYAPFAMGVIGNIAAG